MVWVRTYLNLALKKSAGEKEATRAKISVVNSFGRGKKAGGTKASWHFRFLFMNFYIGAEEAIDI